MLVVDDNEFNVEVVSMIIQRNTMLLCDKSYSALHGIQLIKERALSNLPMYKLLFLDINMPQMDGVEMV
jgi:CheY-like chemotaxis protein